MLWGGDHGHCVPWAVKKGRKGGQAGSEVQAEGHTEGEQEEGGGSGRAPLNLFSSTISGSHTMSEGRRRTVTFPNSSASHCSRLSVQAYKSKKHIRSGLCTVYPPQWVVVLTSLGKMEQSL